MKKILLTSLVTFAFALTGFCSVTIAVLPYSVQYEGRIPKKLDTPEKILEATTLDGENYQTAMIDQLTRIAKKKKYMFLDINVIGQVQIDAMLRQKGIDTVASSMTNAEIAEAIGVTHVVRGTITRIFILSEAEAVGVGVINVLSGGNTSQRAITSTITVRHSTGDNLMDGNVYNLRANRTTRNTRPHQRALRDTFRKAARRSLRNIKKNGEE
jgi:hypothetical protein